MNHDQIDKKYLYKENRILRVEAKEANELKQLHKQAVYKLSQPHISANQVISILLDLLSDSSNDSKIARLNETILELQSKLMVLEKIVEETDNNQKEMYHLLAEDFNKMKAENQKLQGQLHKFYEKIGEVDYLSGLVTKYKEIITPSDQALAFKKEQEQLIDVLSLQKQSIRKLSEEKQKLLKINVHMKDEVEKQKDEVRNMTIILQNPDILNNSLNNGQNGENSFNNGSENILDELNHDGPVNSEQKPQQNHHHNLSLVNIHNSSVLNTSSRGLNTTLNFLKMQKKIIKEEDEDNFGQQSDLSSDNEDIAELNILFPDKIQKIKTQKKTSKVPYLNMVKVRQLMTKRQNKLRKQVEADNRHINPTDKIIKLESQLEITRKQLTNQSLKYRTMSEEIKELIRINEQLANRNQLLVEANERLRLNYQNMYKDYQLTKIIALRFERGMTQKDKERYIESQLNTSKEFRDKIKNAQGILKRIFEGKGHIARSQSEETL